MSLKILKPVILFSSAVVLSISVALFLSPVHGAAASTDATNYCKHQTTTKAACEQGYDNGVPDNHQTVKDACGTYPANSDNLIACQSAWGKASGADPAIYSSCSNSRCDFVGKYINPAINLFSLSFGLIATISIVVGGIQYAASEGDPQKSASAKSRITNTIIAIFVYLFLYVFLQFLIPGGAFH
jgi:hypothetical protein